MLDADNIARNRACHLLVHRLKAREVAVLKQARERSGCVEKPRERSGRVEKPRERSGPVETTKGEKWPCRKTKGEKWPCRKTKGEKWLCGNSREEQERPGFLPPPSSGSIALACFLLHAACSPKTLGYSK